MRRFLIVAATLVLTACVTHRSQPDGAGAAASPDFDVEVTRDQGYVPVDWPAPLAGDIYRPIGAGIRPGIVLIHGGGWTRRSRADMDELAHKLARHGYVVFNVSYRFAPQYRFPAQVRDVQQAVRWLRR
ncbi:MAG: alpha/beta hydrolase, partial [Abyssibacter sp.]